MSDEMSCCCSTAAAAVRNSSPDSNNDVWVTGEVVLQGNVLWFQQAFASKTSSGMEGALGIGRMNYKISPGLYAVGKPGHISVLVGALQADICCLEERAVGLDCWILILDTKGINVWCAAGKNIRNR